MKKRILLILTLLCLLVAAAASAEEAEEVRYKKLSVPRDAESIDLGKVTVSASDYPKFIAFLEQLPNLRHVDMYATKITRRWINKLAETFPDVEFGWSMVVGNHVVRTDAVAFSTAHSDSSGRHRDEDFSVLKYCRNLVALDLGHNAIKDLSFLYDLPHLKILILVDNKFQDITPVASLTELEYLELFYNDIRDVSPLVSLTSLKDLNLGWNRITDISPLEAMTWLERLWIPQYNSHNPSRKPDPASVEAVREALPDTQIDSTAKSSVGNGWRDHPRYTVMRRIFKENRWYPLDGEAP